jgi:hypothetical protein
VDALSRDRKIPQDRRRSPTYNKPSMTIPRVRRVAVVSVLLLAAATARAQPRIRAFSEVIEGHQVGGVAIDAIGNIFVADFGEIVWKLTPEGERREFASGLYLWVVWQCDRQARQSSAIEFLWRFDHPD